jgi:Fic-DOC domain mobile mystery protein B
VGDIFAQPDEAATPLTPEEIRDLIPTHIAYRRELNAAEQQNILRAQQWAMDRRRRDLLSEKFVNDLHRRMLDDVWRWAGKFRTTERNIGIDYRLIATELRRLLDDAKAWIAYDSYPRDEIGARFHHRLTQVHPFPNGNGRHARLMADLLIIQLGGERFSWGRESLREPGQARARYIEALRAADAHDIGPLLIFART